jgi:beta-aspartyl-peptidase (threonine type)
MAKPALAIHGGAGTIDRNKMTPELEREYRSGLEEALRAGWQILEKGGSSLDAVETAVCSLEDFPLFNAGRGSVFTHDGRQEMDAAIMDGAALRAGAVAAVTNVKNPISLARLVMTMTEHALLAGEGANQFAEEIGAQREPDEYFFTEHRWLQLQGALATGRVLLEHNDDVSPDSPPPPSLDEAIESQLGTVGAVALDSDGRLAAATSTGGMTNKKYGRVGDTALIGQGTYADDTCAVSCTGHGEFFMLGVTGYDVSALMRYANLSLSDAARRALERLTSIGGEGGLIAIDTQGNITIPFNSDGMYRGSIDADGAPRIEIYR